jgi:hypothetical protein
MDENLSHTTSELENISADARAKFGGLTAEQLNWKPAPDSWSVGQCLEHLIKTNELYYGEFDKLAAGTRRNSFWENWSPLTSFAGSFLIKSLKSDDRKVKTVQSMTPPSEIAEDIVEQFVSHNSELAGRIKAVANADPKKTVVTSPFMSLITYRLSDGYEIIIEHEKRHIRQAERVTQSDGFPK